jgi:hypothetical protein
MNINFTTIEQGDSSDHRNFDQIVMYNSVQWHDLWEKHTHQTALLDDYDRAYSCHHIPVPQVCFACHSVIAVFAGEKPSTRYSIKILNVEIDYAHPNEQKSSLLTVQYREFIPTGDFLVGHMSTYPYHIIKVSRIDDCNVVFEQI